MFFVNDKSQFSEINACIILSFFLWYSYHYGVLIQNQKGVYGPPFWFCRKNVISRSPRRAERGDHFVPVEMSRAIRDANPEKVTLFEVESAAIFSRHLEKRSAL